MAVQPRNQKYDSKLTLGKGYDDWLLHAVVSGVTCNCRGRWLPMDKLVASK